MRELCKLIVKLSENSRLGDERFSRFWPLGLSISGAVLDTPCLWYARFVHDARRGCQDQACLLGRRFQCFFMLGSTISASLLNTPSYPFSPCAPDVGDATQQNSSPMMPAGTLNVFHVFGRWA